jgi:hypothetical protein
MYSFRTIVFLLFSFLTSYTLIAQLPYLSRLHAGANFPIYTTYAATKNTSQYKLDEAYHFRYDDSEKSADFITDTGGDLGMGFMMNGKTVNKISEMFSPPIITKSYPNLVSFEMYPFKNVMVEGAFLVYSSRLALVRYNVINLGADSISITLIASIKKKDQGFSNVKVNSRNQIHFSHTEPMDQWTRSHYIPMVENIRNQLELNPAADQVLLSEQLDPVIDKQLANATDIADSTKQYRQLILLKSLHLKPLNSEAVTITRQVCPEELHEFTYIGADLFNKIFIQSLQDNEKFMAEISAPAGLTADQEALYYSNVNMMRQLFYPPEALSSYNYYVFSREPTWGWGHGGQVFHESLTMMAYVLVDPESAMNSQRVFKERQYPDGYIIYRAGPYLEETLKKNGVLTSSAPWYAWTNWEVYKKTKDRRFLAEMYGSSSRLYKFFIENRDSDHDGLCEWGGDAVLESVRDSKVAVWDEVGDPSNFEALDLNCMLVKEAKSLEKMALELGKTDEATAWKKDYESRIRLINKTFWDPVNGFYYHVDKAKNSFTFKKKNDLKRDEIIGFLPLWAGVCDSVRAARLVQRMLDPGSFWRKNGIPSLSARDSYYQARGYWNGPVWVQWNYLIERGLLDYGYTSEARQLTNKNAAVMADRLRKDHTLWELYSPDESWGGYHQSYIWAGIINRMLVDVSAIGK